MADRSTRELARRVRQTRALSGSQKRYWLTVLPHLKGEDRERLDAILRGDAPSSAGSAVSAAETPGTARPDSGPVPGTPPETAAGT